MRRGGLNGCCDGCNEIPRSQQQRDSNPPPPTPAPSSCRLAGGRENVDLRQYVPVMASRFDSPLTRRCAVTFFGPQKKNHKKCKENLFTFRSDGGGFSCRVIDDVKERKERANNIIQWCASQRKITNQRCESMAKQLLQVMLDWLSLFLPNASSITSSHRPL